VLGILTADHRDEMSRIHLPLDQLILIYIGASQSNSILWRFRFSRKYRFCLLVQFIESVPKIYRHLLLRGMRLTVWTMFHLIRFRLNLLPLPSLRMLDPFTV
jgi:hypothetical protein